MRKYKLLNGSGYNMLSENVVYEENHTPYEGSYSVGQMVKNHPDDWELVEELTFPREMEVNVVGDWFKQTIECVINNVAIAKMCGSSGIYTYTRYRELSETQEMTIAEIEKELGKKIKIVK